MLNKNKTLDVLLQILIWIAYILLPLFSPAPSSRFPEGQELFKFISVVIATLSVGFYYYHYYFSLPRFYSNNKYLAYSISLIGFMLFSIVATNYIASLISDQNLDMKRPFIIGGIIIRFLLIFSVSFAIHIHRKMKELELEKIKSELSVLKAQIDPHFLFNVLNDIYGQAISKSEHTPDSVLKLSAIMRYVTLESNEDKVSLEKEISYLHNYIDLQRVRLTNRTTVHFEVVGDTASHQIPPLLFISFVENAFKYGVSNEIETTITIKMEVDQKQLIFLVENDIPAPPNHTTESDHVGLKNTQARLDLIYKDAYALDIIRQDHRFTVQLNLQLL